MFKKTKIINLIGSPGTGKSLMSVLIFAEMKKRHLQVELVQEYIKRLIWEENTEALQDQFKIAEIQYRSIASINGKIDNIVLDTSLVNNIYYNKPQHTETIKSWLDEFNNVFIFIERNENFPFETQGRIHNLTESIQIEKDLKKLIDKLQLENVIYIKSNSDQKEITNLLEKILEF